MITRNAKTSNATTAQAEISSYSRAEEAVRVDRALEVRPQQSRRKSQTGQMALLCTDVCPKSAIVDQEGDRRLGADEQHDERSRLQSRPSESAERGGERG